MKFFHTTTTTAALVTAAMPLGVVSWMMVPPSGYNKAASHNNRHAASMISSSSTSRTVHHRTCVGPTATTTRWMSTPTMEEESTDITTTTTTTSVAATAPLGTSTSETTTANASVKTSIAIAEGRIVAQYPGGFYAVRIHDDLTSSTTTSNNKKNGGIRPAVIGVQPAPSILSPSQLLTSTSSLSGDYLGKQVLFPNGRTGVVVTHRPPLIFCFLVQQPPSPSNDNDSSVQQPPSSDDDDNVDGLVRVMDSMVTVSVSSDVRNVDCFGGTVHSTISGKDATTATEDDEVVLSQRPIFAPIPQVANIALINHPMLTGTTMMDTLAPIGRGQNMLMIGSDYTVMRKMVLDMLSTQCRHGSKVQCVYASTEENREIPLQRLRDAGIVDHVHFVGRRQGSEAKTTAMAQTAEAVLIASTACAIGESYALQRGMHSLVIIDNIDQHKMLWDVTTRVLVDVFGIDAVVKSDLSGGASSEMRAFYSSLIQRAGQYNAKLGGGSVTLLLLTSIPSTSAEDDDSTVFQPSDFEQSSQRIKERIALLVQRNIPLTATTLRKINIPIPTVAEGQKRLVLQHIDDLISMSDGQVWLDGETLTGQQPPIDPQRSITRVGIGADTQSRADAPAIRRIAEGIRLELSQAAAAEPTVSTTTAAQKQLRRQRALLLAMHQPPGSGGRRLSESCIVLLAAQRGFLDSVVDTTAVPSSSTTTTRVIPSLLEHVHSMAADVMDEIDATLDLSDSAQQLLTDAISSYFTSTTSDSVE